MKANELMIGDWVMPSQCMVPTVYTSVAMITVDGVYMNEAERLFSLEELHPIPLTEEILERIGFGKRWHDHSRMDIFDPKNDDVTLIHYNHHNATLYISALPFMDVDKHNEREQTVDAVRCQYVHELQHAMRLCGIKKEIKLEG